MDPDKKISFGFSKINKKIPALQSRPVEKNKVELIECLEGQSIKIKDAPEVVDTPLIIPVKSDQKDLLDRIRKVKEKESKKPTEPEDNRPDSELTIEELAARELINDAKNRLSNNDSSKNHLVLLPKNDEDANEEEREPTLDDYERIPVNDFGMAMLRGMGWKEGMGIGKTPSKNKTEAAKPPELRPKGLGLGASRIIQAEIPKNPACDKDGNTLLLKKGAYAKIIAGSHKGDYCEIQGLDEEAARVIVKTSLQGKVLTVNEFLIVVVTKEDYTKNSKVLNNEKYEEYKKISDKNLENYHKSRDVKEEIKSEGSSSRSREEVRVKKNHSDNDEKEEKSHRKSKSTYRDKRDEYSSDDSNDSRDRDRHYKEKDRSSRHHEKNGHRSKSRSRRSRSSSASSRSKESDKYRRKNKR